MTRLTAMLMAMLLLVVGCTSGAEEAAEPANQAPLDEQPYRWERDDGSLARSVLFSTVDGELVETVQVDLFDFGVAIDTSWPDGEPPTVFQNDVLFGDGEPLADLSE